MCERWVLTLLSVALTETNDGQDPSTYSTPSYNGGIWKVLSSITTHAHTRTHTLSHPGTPTSHPPTCTPTLQHTHTHTHTHTTLHTDAWHTPHTHTHTHTCFRWIKLSSNEQLQRCPPHTTALLMACFASGVRVLCVCVCVVECCVRKDRIVCACVRVRVRV